MVVHSTPTVLASLVTDANGSFDTTVTLPAGLPAGADTLAAGVVPDGRPWTLTQAITAGTAGGSGAGVPVAGGLAYTGSDVAVPAIGGLAALIVGGGLVLVGRRRRTAE